MSRFRCLRDYCVGLCRIPHTIVENFLLLSQNSRIRQIFPVERVQKTRNRVSKSAFKGKSGGIAVPMSGYRPQRPASLDRSSSGSGADISQTALGTVAIYTLFEAVNDSAVRKF